MTNIDDKCDNCKYKKHSEAVTEWEKAQELSDFDWHQIIAEYDCDCEKCKKERETREDNDE